jgi:hypothetical protein
MIVNNKSACVHGCGQVKFLVGVNVVTDEKKLAYLKADVGFQSRVRAGVFEVLAEEGKPVAVEKVTLPTVASLKPDKLKEDAAIRVATSTMDRKTLMSLLEQESRPKVRTALEEQLRKMSMPDKKPEANS